MYSQFTEPERSTLGLLKRQRMPARDACAWRDLSTINRELRNACHATDGAYRPSKAPAEVRPELAYPTQGPDRARGPSAGYRTVARLAGMNKYTMQRIFQLQGWRVRRRAIGTGHGSRPCRRWRPHRPELGGGPVPGVGRLRRLAQLGAGDRRPYPSAAKAGSSRAAAGPTQPPRRWSRP